MTTKQAYFAEIVESSLSSWTAQSWEWDSFPEFGSIVMIPEKKRTLFGIVYDINTGSMESGRYPFPYKKTHEELLKEQPQIFEFLKTTFSCIALGYKEHDIIFHTFAPKPPKIHSFVGPLDSTDLKQFFISPNFLHLIFNNPHIENEDELILAIIKNLTKQNLLSSEKKDVLIETYSLLIGNDYKRIKLFLERVQNIVI